ncbi:MAG: GEVED domain-containing protein [Anaerolineae bacterium]
MTGSNGYLVGWFDWNGDGSFGAGEMVTFGTVSAGTNSLSMSVGAAYGGGSINARFRLYDGNPGTPTPTGIAFNGEVEDYQWNFGPSAVTLQGVAVQNTAVPPVLILVLVGLLAMGTAVLWHSRRQFRTQ